MTLRKLFNSFRSTSVRLCLTRRAATAVEFALVAPVFLMMTMGVIEMGRAMYIKSVLQFAVEETARYVAVNQSAIDTDIQDYATASYLNSGGVAPTPVFTATQEVVGSRTYWSITTSYNFSVIVPLVSIPDITLQAKSRMPVG